ncbi:4'-phosphopantetheinyl transferase superfamily protein, partial [Leptolyngbya sp. FACHB-36]|uniref:4'-phosphopantetheinyl transferase family protein n=1 Tax=Leptolyngbya sp. FACHB-36 TaxID=2692808 RepID=UPI00168033E2
FGYEPRGKPVLNYPPCRFQFNLSHSQAMLLCAVTIDHPVGIDLEFIRSTADLEQLTERFFLPQEHRTIHALPPEQRLYAFFQHWTSKEAVLKALGVGLADLESVEVAFTNGVATLMRLGDDTAPAWQLHSFSPAPDCLAAIAVQGSLKPIEFWDWPPV